MFKRMFSWFNLEGFVLQAFLFVFSFLILIATLNTFAPKIMITIGQMDSSIVAISYFLGMALAVGGIRTMLIVSVVSNPSYFKIKAVVSKKKQIKASALLFCFFWPVLLTTCIYVLIQVLFVYLTETFSQSWVKLVNKVF